MFLLGNEKNQQHSVSKAPGVPETMPPGHAEAPRAIFGI